MEDQDDFSGEEIDRIPKKVYLQRNNPLDSMSDDQLIERFRFDGPTIKVRI